MKEKSEKKTPNRLIKSTSPYLLQHAYNPVNWFPWSEEALDKAVAEDKPIIVSIGYSACHWCHVMEHESFENTETAAIMNRDYVCIKVDREERPDIDNIYMDAIHAMGLQGGWPLNVFLTPEQKPFYGGTYFPQQGWQQLLTQVSKAFNDDRVKLEDSANKFTLTISINETEKYKLNEYEAGFDKGFIDAAAEKLYTSLDFVYGGQKKAPKFPMPSIWFLLLRQYFTTKEKKYLDIVTLTLDRMSRGGIYDQLQGGFSRYSVDEKWFAPHFEKMLYDNGQLLSLFAEAYSLTGSKLYFKVIEQTVQWLKDDMLSPEGGFYSALDADSEGVEGKYYVWTSQEIDSILGNSSEIFKSFYDITEKGNWEKGVNILFNSKKLSSFLESNNLTEHEWDQKHESCKQSLLNVRNKRVKPGLDNKILAGWNAMTITGLVKCYLATGKDDYLELAESNADFISENLIDKDFKVIRVYGTDISGVLEDYAFLIEAFTTLYQADFENRWLVLAENLTNFTIRHFFDDDQGMFFYTSNIDNKLIARKKEIFDNVIPSSNSQMAQNLRVLGLLLDNSDWTEMSAKMIFQIKKFFQNDLAYMSHWASSYLSFTNTTAEIAIVGEKAKSVNQAISKNFYPFKTTVGTETEEESIPLLKNRRANGEKTMIYVCFDKACKLPVETVDEALKQLPGFEPAGT